MKVYHGSSAVVKNPDVQFSRENLDFGKGFYVTSYQEQAENWAKRKALRKGTSPIVSAYTLKEDFDGFQVLRFTQDNKAWIDFVCACRSGKDIYRNYDIIIGSVANDKVYTAVDMYYRGIWDIDRTLAEIKYYKMNDQYCLITQQFIDAKLLFIDSYEVPL
ncbi:DUF3990 domain-containing protein [Treponema primitia]|uniref:DUF3990 domain-containing protein n=1 Tax=Treponema primitia TaxID=88058 RepID=UPI00397FF7DF